MLLVGLTGGIGAGKSTVADLLRRRGAVIVDADQAARVIVEPGRPALAALVERFGAEILNDDDTLHRRALAQLAFADEEGKAALNDITWPAIAVEMGEQIEAAPPRSVVVYDAALLLESTFTRGVEFAAVLVVEAPLEVRLDRLEFRGVDREDAQRRIAVQSNDEERRAIATHVIDNSGDPEALEKQANALWDELVALEAARHDPTEE